MVLIHILGSVCNHVVLCRCSLDHSEHSRPYRAWQFPPLCSLYLPEGTVSYSECNSGGPMDPLLAVHPFIVLEDRRNELEKCLFVIKTSWLKHQWFFNFVSESLKTRSPESMEVRVPDLCIPHTMNPVVGWRSFASFKSSFGLLSMLTHLNL